MVVVRKDKLEQVSALARKMNTYYNYRSFDWGNVEMCEIYSPLQAFLAMVKKEISEKDADSKYFNNLS